MYHNKSEYWNCGYKYGMSMNLNHIPQKPTHLNREQLKEWCMGLDAAISDRMS